MMTDKNRKPAVYIEASIISYLAARIHNDLMVAAQLSKEAVSQWLKGEKVPRPAKLLQLSKLLGLNYDDLVFCEKSNVPIVFPARRRFGLNSKEITFSEIMNLYPVWNVFEEFTLIHRMR